MLSVLIVLFASAAFAQPARRETRPPELEALVGLARTAPPAVQAHALLQVAARAGQGWRAELAEEALALAAHAPDPYPMQLIPNIRRSSPVTLDARRRATGLDRLSLEVSALAMMSFAGGASMLERLPRPRIQPAACSDAFVPDVSMFYRQAAFLTHPLNRRRVDVEAYEALLASIANPVEVVPAARMLASIPASPADSARLLDRFTSAIESLNGDDRSFSSTLPLLGSEVQRTMLAMEQRGVTTTAFRRTVRDYVTRQFRSRRCADTAADTVLTARVAKAFELDPEDLRPLEAEGEPDLGAGEEPRQLVELRNFWNRLQFEGHLRGQKAGAQFDAFIERLDQWTEEDDSKLAFVSSLASSTTGEWRSQLLKRYLELLNRMPAEKQSEVFLAVQPLSLFLRSMADAERRELLASLENSHNPALVLFVQLERVTLRLAR